MVCSLYHRCGACCEEVHLSHVAMLQNIAVQYRVASCCSPTQPLCTTQSHKDSVPVVSCVCQACDNSVLDVQVFLGRSDMAACALECAYACTTPHHWPALLAILQAGSASLQEQTDADTSHQDLAEQLREVWVTPCQPGSHCLRACCDAAPLLHARILHVVQYSSQTVASQHCPRCRTCTKLKFVLGQ